MGDWKIWSVSSDGQLMNIYYRYFCKPLTYSLALHYRQLAKYTKGVVETSTYGTRCTFTKKFHVHKEGMICTFKMSPKNVQIRNRCNLWRLAPDKNLLQPKCKGCTGKYRPEVVAVRTAHSEVRTKTRGPIFPSRKCLLVDVFLTSRLSESLAFCEFASVNFKPCNPLYFFSQSFSPFYWYNKVKPTYNALPW